MNRIAPIFFCSLALFLQGCVTNYMFTAEMTAEDSAGDERQVVVYWPMTDPLIGGRKAGPVVLLTECGIPIQFDQQEEGIVFRGNPQDDRFVDGPQPTTSEFECGRFTGDEKLVDIEGGTVEFVIRCAPTSDDFAAIPRSYIAAREEPYEITIRGEMVRSMFGKVLDARPMPDCRR